jgi:hypothetical protein
LSTTRLMLSTTRRDSLTTDIYGLIVQYRFNRVKIRLLFLGKLKIAIRYVTSLT